MEAQSAGERKNIRVGVLDQRASVVFGYFSPDHLCWKRSKHSGSLILKTPDGQPLTDCVYDIFLKSINNPDIHFTKENMAEAKNSTDACKILRNEKCDNYILIKINQEKFFIVTDNRLHMEIELILFDDDGTITANSKEAFDIALADESLFDLERDIMAEIERAVYTVSSEIF